MLRKEEAQQDINCPWRMNRYGVTIMHSSNCQDTTYKLNENQICIFLRFCMGYRNAGSRLNNKHNILHSPRTRIDFPSYRDHKYVFCF